MSTYIYEKIISFTAKFHPNHGCVLAWHFENIKAILHEGGAALDNVVKAVIYVTDVSKFSEISAVRNTYFANSKPVSTLVEISKTVKEGCDVEIEVIALKQKE